MDHLQLLQFPVVKCQNNRKKKSVLRWEQPKTKRMTLSTDGWICTFWASLVIAFVQVPREECVQVPREVPVQVPEQVCDQVAKQVPKEVCRQEERQECFNIPRQVRQLYFKIS